MEDLIKFADQNLAEAVESGYDEAAIRYWLGYLNGVRAEKKATWEMNKINYEDRKTVYQAALRKWGVDLQTMMAVEEMSELTKEICKIKRGKIDLDALADEIADVTIMLEQLRMIYGLNDAVCDHMDAKILRLQSRVGGGAF